MREWKRATWTHSCGCCGAVIDIGAMALVIGFPGSKTQKVRCSSCAGEAPPELAPYEPQRTTKRMAPAATIAQRVRRDFKLAQAGDR